MKKFEVYEDNAGGLFLVVYGEDEKPEYIHSGYEYSPGELSECIKAMKAGENPVTDWDGNEISEWPDFMIQDFDAFMFDYDMVANNDAIYPENMGAAACLEFGIEK